MTTQQKTCKMQTPLRQFACRDPKREGPRGGRIARVPDDLLFLTKNSYSTKTCKKLIPILFRMRGPKKRGSLRRPHPACSWWPFSFDQEQLFNKKHAKCKLPRDRTHARTQKERVPEEAEARVFPMTFYFWQRTAIQQKNMKNANYPETERMREPKKRGSLRKPNPTCSRRPLIFDEEQLFNKKTCKV